MLLLSILTMATAPTDRPARDSSRQPAPSVQDPPKESLVAPEETGLETSRISTGPSEHSRCCTDAGRVERDVRKTER